MFAKLQRVAARYDELGELLSSPETLADMERWTRLSRERAELEPVAQAYRAYEGKRAEMDAALAEAQRETGEMKELLEEEARSLREELASKERELKILLLPKDKNDERGCTLEIRAGAVSGSCKWGRPAPRGLPGGAVPGDLRAAFHILKTKLKYRINKGAVRCALVSGGCRKNQ